MINNQNKLCALNMQEDNYNSPEAADNVLDDPEVTNLAESRRSLMLPQTLVRNEQNRDLPAFT